MDLRSKNVSQERQRELVSIAQQTQLDYDKLAELEAKIGSPLVLQGEDVGYLTSRGFEFLLSANRQG